MDGDRRGDWEKGVDENLAMLNSAQRSTDKEMDEIDLLTQKHERIILGDPENGKIGISAQNDSLETLVNELRSEMRSLRALLYGDHTGHTGLEGRVDKLEDKKARAERREGWAWDSVTKIIVELLVVLGLLLLNWDRVEDFFKARIHHGKPVLATGKKGHGKGPKKPKPKPIVMPEARGDPASDTVQ